MEFIIFNVHCWRLLILQETQVFHVMINDIRKFTLPGYHSLLNFKFCFVLCIRNLSDRTKMLGSYYQ